MLVGVRRRSFVGVVSFGPKAVEDEVFVFVVQYQYRL